MHEHNFPVFGMIRFGGIHGIGCSAIDSGINNSARVKLRISLSKSLCISSSARWKPWSTSSKRLAGPMFVVHHHYQRVHDSSSDNEDLLLCTRIDNTTWITNHQHVIKPILCHFTIPLAITGPQKGHRFELHPQKVAIKPSHKIPVVSGSGGSYEDNTRKHCYKISKEDRVCVEAIIFMCLLPEFVFASRFTHVLWRRSIVSRCMAMEIASVRLSRCF